VPKDIEGELSTPDFSQEEKIINEKPHQVEFI
jgi:hypothetical protein